MSNFIIINKPECLRCAVVAPNIATKAFDCTVENGNEHCPAAYFHIIVGVDVNRAAAGISGALASGDFEKCSRLFAKLATYHEYIQQQVMDEVRGRMLTQALSQDIHAGDTANANGTDDDADAPATGAAEADGGTDESITAAAPLAAAADADWEA